VSGGSFSAVPDGGAMNKVRQDQDILPTEDTLAASAAAARADELKELQRQIGIATRSFAKALPFGRAVRWVDPRWRERIHHDDLHPFIAGYDPARDGCTLISGESGVGKSTAAAVVAHRLLSQAFVEGDLSALIVGGHWTSAPELQRARQETKRGVVDEALAIAINARLLFLDELGGEPDDGRWLMTLADERYRFSRPTVTTSGWGLPALRERYGVGAIRKLVEPLGTHLNLFGADDG
jgi:hypothetical protein